MIAETGAREPSPRGESFWVVEDGILGAEWKRRYARASIDAPFRIYYYRQDGDSDYINFFSIDPTSWCETNIKSISKIPKDKRIAAMLELGTPVGTFVLGFDSLEHLQRWRLVIEEMICKSNRENVEEAPDSPSGSQLLPYEETVLDLLIVEARGLPKRDGSCDGFCKLNFPGYQRTRTSVVKNSCNPVWNEDFSFLVPAKCLQAPVLEICIFNFDTTLEEKYIGRVLIDLEQLLECDKKDLWLDLERASSGSSIGPTQLHVVAQLSTSSSAHPAFLTSYGVPSQILPKRLDSGDLLLFSNVGISAKAVQMVFLRSRWDHIAMVVRRNNNSLTLLESTVVGVRTYRMESRLEKHRADAHTGVRRLLGVNRTPELRSQLNDFVSQVRGRPYASFIELIQGYRGSNTKDTLHEVFCSELVAAAFQKLGLLDNTLRASNFLPSHFAEDRLTLLNGASLDPHIHVFLQILPKHWKLLNKKPPTE